MAPYLSQIAFSVTNLERSVKFYRDTFGLIDSGGVTSFRGPTTEYIQGIKGIASKTHWLQDTRSEFQLEFFEFEYPPRLYNTSRPQSVRSRLDTRCIRCC